MEALSNIPANVITGRSDDGQEAFIADLIALRPPAERWAVLLNTAGASGHTPPFLQEEGVGTVHVTQGCVCCSAQLELRVALNRLLKEMRPHRVLVGVSGVAKPADVLRLLSDRWLSPVLDLCATVLVEDATRISGLGEDISAIEQERLAFADVIAIRQSGALPSHAIVALERLLAAYAPDAILVHTDREQISLAQLNRPANARPRPRFQSDNQETQ